MSMSGNTTKIILRVQEFYDTNRNVKYCVKGPDGLEEYLFPNLVLYAEALMNELGNVLVFSCSVCSDLEILMFGICRQILSPFYSLTLF
jgi:hypothetical protein